MLPNMSAHPIISGLEIRGPMNPGYAGILTPDACTFLAGLVEKFGPRRRELLAQRVVRQHAIDAGQLPDFLPETSAIRGGNWQVAPIPPDLLDRRTEITGPVDRKMAINALNSGAQCWMADFEDANSPTWENVMDGQVNMFDAARHNFGAASQPNSRRSHRRVDLRNCSESFLVVVSLAAGPPSRPATGARVHRAAVQAAVAASLVGRSTAPSHTATIRASEFARKKNRGGQR